MKQNVTRREFAKRIAAVSVAVPMAGHQVASADEPKEPVAAPVTGENGENKADTKPEATPAELLLEFVKQRYADERLDDEALASIAAEIQGDLLRSRVLSMYPLKNSDQPASAFAAYRGD